MRDFIDLFLTERRTLEQALADLRLKYAQNPGRQLADMIRQAEAEILDRGKRPGSAE
jgi:hypothetical protein